MCNIYIYIYIYIYIIYTYIIYVMPNGNVRGSHLVNFFKVTGRIEKEINQRPKRLREENNQSPEIIAETPSTATLVEGSIAQLT